MLDTVLWNPCPLQMPSGRGSLQAVPSMLWAVQQGLCSGTCRLSHLTGVVCWPCTGGESLSWGWKWSPFVPKVGYGAALPGELLCVALGAHEGKWSRGAFSLRWHCLHLLNLKWRSEKVIFHEMTWRDFKFIFESSVTCLVSSPMPVYLTCVYSYFPFFFLWLTNKMT